MWINIPGWRPAPSFVEPVAVPASAPSDSPQVCLSVNQDWVPYILGAMAQLTQPTTWVDSPPGAAQAAIDDTQDIMAAWGALPACAASCGLFNGEDNYLTAGPASAFDFHTGSGLSVLAWVYTCDIGAVVNQDRNTSGGTGYALDLVASGSNRQAQAAINNGVSQVAHAVGNVLFGLVAFTLDGSNLRQFYNGSLVATTACTILPAYSSSQPLQIGMRTGVQHFSGLMKDVQLYAGRVPDADIAAIYAAGSGTSGAATLRARWLLDEGTGTTAADSSGNGNTATWHGSTPVWGTWPT